MRGVGTLCALVALMGCGPAPVHPPPPMCTRLCTSPNLTQLDVVAGQPGGPGWVDGVGAAVHFVDPWTMTGDGAGHLFLLDGSMIRQLDTATATVTTLAGSYGVAAGMDGVGMQASFYAPSGIVSTNGTLYVTDTENHTVRKIDVATATVTTYAGAYSVSGTDDGPADMARFREPEGLALDGGKLFVADTDNNTIRQIDLATGDVSTPAGSAGVIGAMDGSGSGALFSKPKALASNGAGVLFIIDSGNQSIRKMVIAGAAVTTLAAMPTLPLGLTVDGTDVLVALADHTIVRVDGTSGAISALAGATNMNGFTDGAAAAARFTGPAGLWIEGGTLYIADEKNFAVRKLALGAATVSTVAGANPVGTADGIGGAARFFSPQGLVIDSNGIAYAADTYNNLIRKIVLATGEVTTLAAGTTFNTPSDLALDEEAGILYIADTGNRAIQKLDLASGEVSRQPVAPAMGSGFTTFDYPTGIAVDQHQLYVTDYTLHVVVAVDPATALATILAGKSRTPGPTDGVGKDARFYSPSGVVADGAGQLYVADVQNNAIRKVVIADGTVTTLAGAPGSSGSADGDAMTARFSFPSHLAIDGVGDLFVADTLNQEIRHVDLSTGDVITVIGTSKVPGVKLGPLPAQITAPSALAIDPDARLLFFSESSLLVAQ